MKSGFFLCLSSLLAGSTLVLSGCAGLGTPATQQTTSYQLTVTAPQAGTGTITSSPAGINCPSTCTASFAQGTKVTLTATPSANYYFSGWGGSCSGTTCSITINAATSVSANFARGVGVTVALSGTGTGTVTSSPAGINCSASTSTTCTAAFAPNTQVSLMETPGTGDTFAGWTGACSGTTTCSVTVTTGASVTAAFTAPADALTVSITGTGTVTSMPTGINCSNASATGCTATFAAGTQVTLSETPGTNFSFSAWGGACLGSVTCMFTLTATNSVTATFTAATGSLQSINHIILFAQENRSLDHYFGQMQAYWAANPNLGFGTGGQTFDGLPQTGTPHSVAGCAPGTWGDSCSPNASYPISSFHLQSVCIENQSPFWNEAHNQWDFSDPAGTNPTDITNPPLNGFAFTAAYDAGSNGFMDLEGVRAMGYYDYNDLNYYYFLASSFATSDRWFAPIMSRTQLNRMYLLAATSDGLAYPIGQGCPPSQCPGSQNNGTQLASTTIFQELQAANITWRIYVDPNGISNTAGQSCASMTGSELSACLVDNSYINEFQYENTILNNPTLLANVQPISQFAIDAANNALPQFALIEPASSAGLDEHPSDSDEYPVNIQDGQSYAATMVINPLMKSASWGSSALIFTYDEWGGLYDHVPPQPATAPGDFAYPTDLNPTLHDICTGTGELGNGMCDFSWTGYRVPVIVISPFANKNYVSHTVRDTTSVLNLVEERFGLKPLTARDGAQPVMDEFFDFTTPPWTTPPTPPTPNQSGSCNQTPPASWNEPAQLSVAVSGGGTITSSPAGINCDSDEGQYCGETFTSGTAVTLTATPNSGGTFTGWSRGACSGTSNTCTITVNSAQYVQANFQ
ncbi:MAG TPA: alkaline phosphatase family protein [Candidatus Deferrimicrobiaceae bacterium]|nr:alkaline phosphatase family protein [Candidatus Deferrimicrobiaceae bacterium]